MRNLLILLGGGALVYWYMCTSKKHNCNCKGDFAMRFGNKLSETGGKIAQDLDQAILQQDGKPRITSTGINESVLSFESENELIPAYNRGAYLWDFNLNRSSARNSISSLYKRYNTSKEATVSPSRVKVISFD
jgi:hypothetical protein